MQSVQWVSQSFVQDPQWYLTALFLPVLTFSQGCGASGGYECEVLSSGPPDQCLTHTMTRAGAGSLCCFWSFSVPVWTLFTDTSHFLSCDCLACICLILGKSPHLTCVFPLKIFLSTGVAAFYCWPLFFHGFSSRVYQPLPYLPLISLSHDFHQQWRSPGWVISI